MARSTVLSILGAGFHVTPLVGHEANVTARAMAPDGAYALTGDYRGQAILWETASGTARHALRPHGAWINSVAFDAQGVRAATGSADGTAQVWDVASGLALGPPLQHGTDVHWLAFGPHTDTLIVGVNHGRARRHEVRIWNLVTGASTVLGPFDDLLVRGVLSKDRSLLATACRDGTTRVWDLQTQTLRHELSDGTGSVWDAAFSPDAGSPDAGFLATARTDGCARVYDLASGAVVATMVHTARIKSVEFRPTGHELLTASEDYTARLWTWDPSGTRPALEVRTLSGHDGAVHQARFRPDGAMVVTVCDDQSARLFDANTGEMVRRLELGEAVYGASFDPMGRRLLLEVGQSPRSSRIWDLDQGRGTITLRGHRNLVRACLLSPRGDRAITACDDRFVRVWSTRDGRLLHTLPDAGSPVLAVALDPRDGLLAVATEQEAWLCREQDGVPVLQLSGHDGGVVAIGFSATGDRIVTAGRDATVRVWDRRTGAQLRRLELDAPAVWARLSPDGSQVVTVAENEPHAVFWAVDSGAELRRLVGHTGAVRTAEFDDTGTHVVTASTDGTARVWALDAPSAAPRVLTHDSALLAACFGPGAALVATSGADGNVRLWHRAEGALELTFSGHRGPVRCTCFAADGRHLLSVADDYVAHLWPADPVGLARELRLRPFSPEERDNFELAAPDPTSSHQPPGR